MYERFTDRARKVMQLANEEAMRFRQEYIGTEHILLGLVREGSDVAALVLKDRQIYLSNVRKEVEKIIIRGPDVAEMLQSIPPTPRAKKVIEYAIDEARKLNHKYVGTEHLLLGVIRDNEGVGAQLLINLGLNLASFREDILVLIGNVSSHLIRPQPAVSHLPARVRDAIAKLDETLELLQQMKENAIARMDWDWAAALRDQTDAIKKIRGYFVREGQREPRDSG